MLEGEIELTRRDGGCRDLVSSSSTRKSGYHLTSNKKMLPTDFVTFPQVSRIARAKATSLVRETRAKMGDLKGKAPHAIVRLRVLAYEKHAAPPVARLATPWHRQESLGLLSPPQFTTTTARQSPKSPSFLKRLRNHIPFDARLVSRWLGLFR